jgi:molybdopterin-containing oxidoreductase family iron-sulfur binding subunit
MAVTTAAVSTAAVSTGGCSEVLEEFMRRRLQELDRTEMDTLLADLEAKYERAYGREVNVEATPPIEGVLFAYGLDLTRCNGNRLCVHACVEENNQSRADPGAPHDNPIEWITVLEMEKAKGVDLHHADAYYDPDTVPREGKFYFPVQCQQCANPPCVKVCPVKATYQEPDGIVVIDYDWCIGCRCCMSACPYGARHFNWTEPNLPAEELNPEMHVLGNRPRPRGIVEKCTFCIQRTRKGKYPACHDACPTGARVFGNLLDPKSEIRQLIDRKRVFVFKAELNTQPRFFYFYG